MKKIYPFIKLFSAALLLVSLCSFINPIKQVYSGPLFLQKFVEVSLLPQNFIHSTQTVLTSLKKTPLIRVLHHATHSDDTVKRVSTPVKQLEMLFQTAEPFEFIPRAICQLRQLGVQSYGLEYPLSQPVVLGMCYRDLSREQITVIEHPSGANGFDLGLYFNKNRFSTGIYSGVTFQKWMNFGDEDAPGISILHRRGPYAGVEMSVRF